jgi:hypothetical protein
MNSHRLGAATGLLCALVLALMVTALPSAGAKTPEPPRSVNPRTPTASSPWTSEARVLPTMWC